MAEDTGLGATLTALPGSWSGNCEQITLHTATIPTVPDDHLGTTVNMTKRAGDLSDPGQVVLTLQHDNETAPPVNGTTGTLTITDALASGQTTAANWSGTAIVTSVDHGGRVKNELNKLTVTLDWDGKTGPTFTAAT